MDASGASSDLPGVSMEHSGPWLHLKLFNVSVVAPFMVLAPPSHTSIKDRREKR